MLAVTELNEKAIRDLGRFAAVVYIAAVCLAIPFGSFNVTFSVAFGGALALLNLAYLESFLKKVIQQKLNPQSAGFAVALSFYVRFGLMGVAIYYFIVAGWINFPALLAGLSVTVFSIVTWFLLIVRFTGLEHGLESGK